MNYYRKCINAIIVALLSVSFLYFFSQNTSAATYTGTLNHNTYVYNKNGRRKTSYRKLLKGQKVTLVGNIISKTITNPYTRGQYDGLPTKSPYYFVVDITGQPVRRCYLSYHMIKKQPYYSIGKGNYLKAINVGRIGGYGIAATEATCVMLICIIMRVIQFLRWLKRGKKSELMLYSI